MLTETGLPGWACKTAKPASADGALAPYRRAADVCRRAASASVAVRDLSISSPAVGPCQVPTLWQGISPGSLERIVATARSIARSTYAPHRNLGIGLHYIPGASGFPGRAPGGAG